MHPYKTLERSPSQNSLLCIEQKKCVNCNNQEQLYNDTDWGFFIDLETFEWVRSMMHTKYAYNRHPIDSSMITINEHDEYEWGNNNNPLRTPIKLREFQWLNVLSCLKDTSTGIMIVMNIKGIFATMSFVGLTCGAFMLYDKYNTM